MENRTRNKPGKPAGDNPQLLHLGEYLAEAAGVSRSTLHTIEHGGMGVRWEKVAAVAQALGLELTFKDRSE